MDSYLIDKLALAVILTLTMFFLILGRIFDTELDSVLDPRLSGTWSMQDGILHCDGFPTKEVEDNFCSSDVPNDWEEFEFNGKTYFREPLASL